MAGGAGGFGSSDDDLIAGINVTPLVDVVLVLLVIFLITAPVIYQSAIQVQLPKAKSGEQTEKSPLSFTISKDGTVSWGAQPVNWADLPGRLAEAARKDPEQTAVISADEATPHGQVVKLMDALRQAGLLRFALNVDRAP
jgi:biopolymer transport protein ExbD